LEACSLAGILDDTEAWLYSTEGEEASVGLYKARKQAIDVAAAPITARQTEREAVKQALAKANHHP